jgi:hypothetical protein
MHNTDSTSSTATRALSTTVATTGTWYHLVGVRDKLAGTMKLYVNGALQATTTYTGGWASNGNLAVGRARWTNSSDWLNGVVDEVQVFAGALTAAEVTTLFTNP